MSNVIDITAILKKRGEAPWLCRIIDQCEHYFDWLEDECIKNPGLTGPLSHVMDCLNHIEEECLESPTFSYENAKDDIENWMSAAITEAEAILSDYAVSQERCCVIDPDIKRYDWQGKENA